MSELHGDFSTAGQYQKLKTGKIALFDADRVKYIVSSRIKKKLEEYEISKRADIFPSKEDRSIVETKAWLANWFTKIGDPIIFCFSGKSYNTFRAHLAIEKEYKGNRKSEESYEGCYSDMHNAMKYIQENYMCLIYEDLEADDILSMLQDDNTYILSHDKDLKTVPGYHYNMDTNQIEEISKKDALYFLSTQLLTGDTTDNISGLPGIGPKKAEALLSGLLPTQYLHAVLIEYQKKYGLFKGTDMFAETWMLIKMREDRGEHFKLKYKGMYDLKESLVLKLKAESLENELK